MFVSSLPTATGRIELILLADAENENHTIDDIVRRYGEIFCAFAEYGSQDPKVRFWVLVKFNYNLGGPYEPGEERGDALLATRFMAFRERLETMYAEKASCFEEFDWDPYEQVSLIEPNIDFKELAREVIVSRMVFGETPNLHINDLDDFEIWIQDAFHALRNEHRQIVMLQPYYIFDRKGTHFESALVDKYISQQLSSMKEAFLQFSRFDFEGGNILAEDDFVLVGPSNLRNSWERYGNIEGYGGFPTYKNLQDAMLKDLGANHLLVPGMDTVPSEAADIPTQDGAMYHLDVFITLGGIDHQSGKQIVWVAEFYEREGTKKYRKQDDSDPASLNARMKKIVDWFEQKNHPYPLGIQFKVLPMPCFTVKTSGSVFSYCNCLMERKGRTKIAYVSDFAIDDGVQVWLKKLLRKFYKAEVVPAFRKGGYQAVAVKGRFFDYAKQKGAFHCIAKVLQRSN